MKKTKWFFAVVLVSILMQSINPTAAKSAPQFDQEMAVMQDVRANLPLGIEITQNAIEILSNGWDSMNSETQEIFADIFDPGDTGDFDDEYIAEVVENYQKILRRLEEDLPLEYVEDHPFCSLMRLYFTNYRKIYVCPYYLEEDSPDRKARVLVHEVAHQVLLVVDRTYYDPKSYSSKYNALVPQASWISKVPVIGHLIREINHSDTQYNPDSYSWFASLVAQAESF